MNFSSWTNPEHSSAPHADFVCVNMLETTYIDSRDKRHWPLSLFQYGQTHGYRWPHWKWWFSSGFQGIPPKFSSTSISNKAKDDSDVETENKTWNDSSTLVVSSCVFWRVFAAAHPHYSEQNGVVWVETNHELAGSMNSLKRKKNNPHNHATSSQYLKKKQ